MDKTKKNFIMTSDKDTSEKLQELGFQLISDNNGIYTFINCPALLYSNDVKIDRITYSNVMCI